jgi:hypothetical protein
VDQSVTHARRQLDDVLGVKVQPARVATSNQPTFGRLVEVQTGAIVITQDAIVAIIAAFAEAEQRIERLAGIERSLNGSIAVSVFSSDTAILSFLLFIILNRMPAARHCHPLLPC